MDELAGMFESEEVAVPVKPYVDKKSVEDTKTAFREIDAEIEKTIADNAARMADEIRSMESMLEYSLKALEEQGKTAREAAKAAADMFGDASEVLGGGLGELTKLLSEGKGTYFLREYLDEQVAIQKELAAAQAENLEAQARLADAKADAMERGDAEISITADGLEPELEAFMWRIIERVQVRATEEGAEFLLGLAS
jgi:hypothetical protein